MNFGDCFAYALAKLTGEPLLFKGEDFKKTGILSALEGHSLLLVERIVVEYAIDYSAGLSRIVARDEARSESPPAYRRSLDDRQRIVTIASVSFKLSTFESTEVATTLSILKAVVPDGAVVRILKWKIAICPSAMGSWPPERAHA